MTESSEQIQMSGNNETNDQLLGYLQVQSSTSESMPVQLMQGDNNDGLLLQPQSIEFNGERHVILSQAQDPETGELLVVLQSENGEHIALPADALTSGLVQVSSDGNDQVIALVPQGQGNDSQNVSGVSSSGVVAVSLDNLISTNQSTSVLSSLIANIPNQIQQTTAPTNVVQAIDTPKMTTQEDQGSSSLLNVVNTNSLIDNVKSNDITNSVDSKMEETTPDQESAMSNQTLQNVSLTKTPDSNTTDENKKNLSGHVETDSVNLLNNDDSKPKSANKSPEKNSVPSSSNKDLEYGSAVIQVQDSGSGTPLETLVANAMVSGGEGNYVIMATTDDGQVANLPAELNLSDVINAGSTSGQTFLIETPEGLVACTAATNEEGAVQLVTDNNGENAAALIGAAQAAGNLMEGQIIQATASGQTVAYTITSTSNGFEITPVAPVQQGKVTTKSKPRSRPPPKTKPPTTSGQTILQPSAVKSPPTPVTAITAKKRSAGSRTKPVSSPNAPVVSPPTSIPPLQPDSLKVATTTSSASSMLTSVPGPSQLAASRRTYSKKSNIVWLNLEQSQLVSKPELVTTKTPISKTTADPKITATNTAIKYSEKSNMVTAVKSSVNLTGSPVTKVQPTSIVTNTSQKVTINKSEVKSLSPVKSSNVTEKSSGLTKSEKLTSQTTKPSNTKEEIVAVKSKVEGSSILIPKTSESETVKESRKSPEKNAKKVKEQPAKITPTLPVASKTTVENIKLAEKLKVDTNEKKAEDVDEKPARRSSRKGSVTMQATVVETNSKTNPNTTISPKPETTPLTSSARITRGRRSKSSEQNESETPILSSEVLAKEPESKDSLIAENSETQMTETEKETPKEEEKVKKTEENKDVTPDTGRKKGSAKRKVQFDPKAIEADEDKLESRFAKRKPTPVATRRSLRSATPKSDEQEKDVPTSLKNGPKDEKESSEVSDDTPKEELNELQLRSSTRKRKVKSTESVKELNEDENKTKSSVSDEKAAKSNINITDTPSIVKRGRGRPPKKSLALLPEQPTTKKAKPILKRETWAPTSDVAPTRQFETFLSDEEENEEQFRRKTLATLSELRSPNEYYEYSSSGCTFHIRHQSNSLTCTPRTGSGNYNCQKCGYHTTRVNNLVLHHKDQCSYVRNAVLQQWQAELQKPTKLPESSTSSTAKIMSEPVPSTSGDSESANTTLRGRNDPPSAPEKSANLPTPNISDIDALLMVSDDEEAVLGLDSAENSKKEFGFAEDDIVWVESHNLHWPALVGKVHVKERKVQVKLIDSPWKKGWTKVSFGTISLFDNADINKKHVREGRQSIHGNLLVKAAQKAEDFLRKRCLGNEISAAKFFQTKDNSESFSGDEQVSSEIPNNNSVADSQDSVTNNVQTSSVSPVADESEDEAETNNIESNEAMALWKEKRRLHNTKLLQCIKEGKVETHLVGVYRESIPSERHQKFKSGSDAEKNQLKHVPWFGPIDDEEQQEEIYDYCSQLFKTNFKTEGSFDTVAYIFEVWVPEAIVKAISRVRRMELKDAEAEFSKGVILSKSEKAELTKEIQKEAEKQLISCTGPTSE